MISSFKTSASFFNLYSFISVIALAIVFPNLMDLIMPIAFFLGDKEYFIVCP